MQPTEVENNVVTKDLLNFEHRWKLRDWIDESKLEPKALSFNPNSIYFWEKHIDQIDACFYSNPSGYHLINRLVKINSIDRPHYFLSINRSAVHILERNQHLIDWSALSTNTAAIHLLEHNKDKIHWRCLSGNPAAIHLLEANPEKIDWELLSKNPAAIHLLEQNQDKICWSWLSQNPAAIHLIQQNLDKIDLMALSRNPVVMYFLENNLLDEDNLNKIDWYALSEQEWAFPFLERNQHLIKWRNLSRNPAAIQLLEQNQDASRAGQATPQNGEVCKIYWHDFSQNPAIFELDYDFFHKRMMIINEELMMKTWHPNRFRKWCLDIDEVKELC